MRIEAGMPNSRFAEVWLNGMRVEHVIAVDTDERWIDRYRLDGSNHPIVDGDHFSDERIHISQESRLEVRDLRTGQVWAVR